MLPDSSGCSDPECIQGRLGHCNTHSHNPRKPKPQYAAAGRNHLYLNTYGGNHHTQHGTSNTANMYHGGGGSSGMVASMHQGSPGSMSGAPLYSSQGLVPSGLQAAHSKDPSVGEEAEGPGTGPLGDTEQDCAGAARRLQQVMNWMRDNGHMGAMLRDFAHSDSCSVSACSPFCRMFRRVRRHVQGAQHPCMLLRTYAVLLRLHVSSCTDTECGLRACPTLRNRNLAQSANNQQQISTDQQEDRLSDVDMPDR